MIDSVSVVLSDDAGDKINAKMSTQPQVDVPETAKRADYKVNDARSMADNEKGEVNSTDQTQSNNNTTNQTNACNIQMDTIDTTTTTTDISECSLNGLAKNDVTIVSPTSSSPPPPPPSPSMTAASVPLGASDPNSVKYIATIATTATNLSPIVLSPCRNATTIVDSSSDDDFDEIQKLFETKPLAIEKWLRERAPQDVLMKMHAATECARTPKSPKLRTPSVTSDLFQQWLASSPVQVCRKSVGPVGSSYKKINEGKIK